MARSRTEHFRQRQNHFRTPDGLYIPDDPRNMVDSRWIDRTPVTDQQSCMLVRTSVSRHEPRQPKPWMLRVVSAAIGHAYHAETSIAKLVASVG